MFTFVFPFRLLGRKEENGSEDYQTLQRRKYTETSAGGRHRCDPAVLARGGTPAAREKRSVFPERSFRILLCSSLDGLSLDWVIPYAQACLILYFRSMKYRFTLRSLVHTISLHTAFLALTSPSYKTEKNILTSTVNRSTMKLTTLVKNDLEDQIWIQNFST